MPKFEVVSPYQPSGDQPEAIAALAEGIENGLKEQVLLGVTGGIAAYKSCEIVRGLQKAGVRVKVCMTEHATHFVDPVTFRSLTHEKVAVDLFDDPTDPIHHISLAEEADAFVIAPCTANVLAKLANGIADDLLTTTALACTAPLVLAPAMNVHMYEAAATRYNIGKLGIPLALLEKPGQLTDEEFPKVKRHADLSRLWLDAVPGFERVSVWGGGHHERLDGKGYPLGLKGEEIPLPSRIMAIADVFTALTEDRPYRKGMTPPEALRIVEGMVKQGHLDGDLSRLLCDHADELDAVRASSQAEARRGFQALHDACAEPDELLRD